jgi:lipopolysaccharide biosynthesis regulator YciM
LKNYLGSEKRVNEKLLELYMVLFSENKMLTELLDLSSNWAQYSSSSSMDIKNYYLSEALLSLKSNNQDKGFYTGLIQKGLKDDEGSEMYTLSLMKAQLKEGSPEAAVNLYKELSTRQDELEFQRD